MVSTGCGGESVEDVVLSGGLPPVAAGGAGGCHLHCTLSVRVVGGGLR